MTPIKITSHAAIQLERRYGVSVDRSVLRAAVTKGHVIFRMSGGEVRAVEADGPCYVVVRNDSAVTVLTWAQAFADCPRAVFAHMVRKGRLDAAFAFRLKHHKGLLPPPQDPQSVKYPRACDTIWCAFKFLETR